jgi:hypothetical protein
MTGGPTKTDTTAPALPLRMRGRQRGAYVAIAKGSVIGAIEHLGVGRIKGKKFNVGRATAS